MNQRRVGDRLDGSRREEADPLSPIVLEGEAALAGRSAVNAKVVALFRAIRFADVLVDGVVVAQDAAAVGQVVSGDLRRFRIIFADEFEDLDFFFCGFEVLFDDATNAYY